MKNEKRRNETVKYINAKLLVKTGTIRHIIFAWIVTLKKIIK